MPYAYIIRVLTVLICHSADSYVPFHSAHGGTIGNVTGTGTMP